VSDRDATAEVVRRWLAAFGGPKVDAGAVAELLHPAATFVERPNRYSPGGERDRETTLASIDLGGAAFPEQRLEPTHVVVDGETAAVRATWTGVTADGTELRSHSALFFTQRDGLVWRVESYDAFPPPEEPERTAGT
jgi:ketosteroid isomerase-like protein